MATTNHQTYVNARAGIRSFHVAPRHGGQNSRRTIAFIGHHSAIDRRPHHRLVADELARIRGRPTTKGVAGEGVLLLSDSGLEGVSLGMLKRVDGQIDIEIWPAQVRWGWPLHVKDRVDGGLLEPGELLERQEQFAAVDEHPEAVLGDVGDLSGRSGCSRHL